LGYSLIRSAVIFLVLWLITHKNKNFNYLFDGIVYSVFVSLGFAVFENIHFILQNNLELLLPKLITSVCCRLFIGIIMGYFYTMWNMRFAANQIENKLLKAGVVEKDNIKAATPWFVASIVVPMLISGLYYLAGSLQNDNVVVVFYTAVFFVFGASFLTINQIAKKDVSYGKYLYRIIAKGHNKITPQIIEQVMAEDLFDDEEVLGE
jgi:RsiW-degrading membrane proteinase PrsW (M82 family)